MNPKVLITGAGGKFGEWVIPLLSPAFDYVLTDRVAGEAAGRKIHAVDLTDYPSVLAAMQGIDAVVHLAIASQRAFVTDNERFDADEGEEYLRFNEASIDVNVRGTYHLFEAARAAGVKRVVYGSSLTIFLGQPRYAEVNDDLPPRPFNFYAVTKLFGEQLGELFSRRHGMTVYSLRFGEPYPKEIHRTMARPPASSALVTFPDLARSIECALTAANGPGFEAYIIVSDCANPRYSNAKAAEIGWKSRSFFEADGRITSLPE